MSLIQDINEFKYYTSKIQVFFSGLAEILGEYHAHIKCTQWGFTISAHGRNIYKNRLVVLDNDTLKIGEMLSSDKRDLDLIDRCFKLFNKYNLYISGVYDEKSIYFCNNSIGEYYTVYIFEKLDISEKSIEEYIDNMKSLWKDF